LGTFLVGGPEGWNAGPAFKRGREFLQYLVSYPRSAAPRETLLNAFWPTLESTTALHRLHLAVAGARAALRALGPALDGIRCAAGAYFWDARVAIDSDATALLEAARSDAIAPMKAAADLYGGEYLAGEDAEWIYPLRLRCANAYAQILERLSEDAFGQADYPEAFDYAVRLVEVDRSHEGATRLVMRSLAAMGRRGAALAAYDALAAYLQHHLALRPCRETVDLRAEIMEKS
jgi:DNA-binding SARP family transcriptional activator